jgi:hypothetical protein
MLECFVLMFVIVFRLEVGLFVLNDFFADGEDGFVIEAMLIAADVVLKKLLPYFWIKSLILKVSALNILM